LNRSKRWLCTTNLQKIFYSPVLVRRSCGGFTQNPSLSAQLCRFFEHFFTNFYENLRRFMLFLRVSILPILPNRYNPTCCDDAYHASALARRAGGLFHKAHKELNLQHFLFGIFCFLY
jgi:hypothetical protein